MPTWFEVIFNTQSHYGLHIVRNSIYLDGNHAGILIIQDNYLGRFN